MRKALFDVVAVRVRGPGTVDELALPLAQRTGVPAPRVALALHDGDFVVHRAIERELAEQAADELHALGIDIEVRRAEPSRSVGPDPLRDAGFVSTSVGDDRDLLDPSRPQGRPARRHSDRPFSRFERGTTANRAARTMGDATDTTGAISIAPPPFADVFPREVVDGESPRSTPIPEIHEGSSDITEPIDAEVVTSVPIAGVNRSLSHIDPSEIEADHSATTPLPSHTSIERAGSEPDSASWAPGGLRTTLADAYPTTSRYPTIGQPAPTLRTRRDRPWLGRDRLAATLFGLTIGVAIGTVVAFAVPNGRTRLALEQLEHELAEAYAKPDLAGRPVVAVQADLAALYLRSRARFLATMFGVALPLGLLLARINPTSIKLGLLKLRGAGSSRLRPGRRR